MNLHEEQDAFLELISLTAEYFKIPEVYVEKDYWITRVLLNLSQSDFKSDFIFKGGTALSKVYGLISRFSEDVDLAMFNQQGLSNNQVKKHMKSAGSAISAGLKYIKRPDETKGSQFRKVYYEFPRNIAGEFGHASDVILLEMNSFTSPEPFSLMTAESLIAEFISNAKMPDGDNIIALYGLEKFEINVLDIKRTVAEKILGLVRAGRAEEPELELADKIRHICDLCLIRRDEKYRSLFLSEDLQEIIGIVIEADRIQFEKAGNWLDQPLHESLLFNQPDETWGKIRNVFHESFAELVYDKDLPSDIEVIELLFINSRSVA